jgi:methyl coenzyme M reductase subunit C-like uncharacterized protein (methanogenesis marker protein 7)
MRLLVLSADPVTAEDVREALGPDAEAPLSDTEVLVVSPALNESPVAFWVSDSDEAIADAREAAAESVAALAGAGADAHATTGESEPLLALQDALAQFPADLVLIFVRPTDEQRYKEEEVVEQARARFDVPIRAATLTR